MRVRRFRLGFTLIELMVVILITLVIMGLLTSFFITTTKVVSSVELKLHLVAEARGILDTFDEQFINAAANERGGLLSVKSLTYVDTDSNPKVSKDNTPDSNRKLDSFNYEQVGSTGKMAMSNYPNAGGYPFPLNPGTGQGVSEVLLRSNVHYSMSKDQNGNYSNTSFFTTSDYNYAWILRPDVSRLWYELIRMENNTDFNKVTDRPLHALEPGSEVASLSGLSDSFKYHYWQASYYTNQGGQFSEVPLMDMSISVWDDTTRTFNRVPTLHAVYFAPIPKALLVTITVCDPYKKGRISYSRIIRMPAGTGDGHFDSTLANADTLLKVTDFYTNKILANNPGEKTVDSTLTTGVLIADDKNHNHKLDPSEVMGELRPLTRPYNRLKKLLDINGDANDAFDLLFTQIIK